YLSFVIGNWDGEVVIMGDLMKCVTLVRGLGRFLTSMVRRRFNSFIVNAGLVEVPLGEGSDADGHRRREVVRLIQEMEKVDAMEVAQKAKIQWSIEGDENSKYYHGVLNTKRGRLTIRGVLLDEIPKGGNSSFITLILKVPNANMV
nr:RNA-directed DNA polymerase, eukaryota [Tanacetum cinerariifolium]